MPKIGLEIHGYLMTNEKLFCRCKSQHGLKFTSPNTNICPICTAQPGAKPMLPNKTAIKKVIQISLILGCKISQKLIWQRKHYDWPDLPKGFQNTISGPHAVPIGEKGNFLGIKIKEVHLEEDPASWNPLTGEIDYNRSGVPLVEIVTEPSFSSPEQVAKWLRQLSTTLNYVKTIDKSAGIKADVNISLPEKKGERVEVKNINSIKNIQKALEYEIKRQKKSKAVLLETRMFDEAKKATIKMREKELAQDYRFIPEPDLPAIILKKEEIEKIKKSLPETPKEKLKKLIKKYKIKKRYAEVLVRELEIVKFFEEIINKVEPKLAVRWVTEELLSVLNYNKKELDEIDIKPEHFIELLKLIENKKITELKAKDILRSWIPHSFSLLEVKKIGRISDRKEIEKICNQVIQENTKAVKDYKQGKQESLNFLIGRVMKVTDKRADYKAVKEILEKLLKD